jgi:DNA-binding NarL/FixJ family response regulator
MFTTSQETAMFYSSLSARRVFIVGNDSLFEEGITKLLAYGTDLSVSGMKYTDDQSLLNAVAQHRPDVIVVNESMPFDAAHILGLIFSAPTITALYVIIIRLGSNMVDVHEMPKRLTVTKRDEFVAVVQGNYNCI